MSEYIDNFDLIIVWESNWVKWIQLVETYYDTCQTCLYTAPEDDFTSEVSFEFDPVEYERMTDEEKNKYLINRVNEGTKCPVCGGSDVEETGYNQYDDDGGEEDWV